MSEFAINKTAILILTLLTLITLILLIYYLYFHGYVKNEEKLQNSTSQSWTNIKTSTKCVLENYIEVLNKVSDAVKSQESCTRVTSKIKSIEQETINLDVECIIINQQSGTVTIKICEVIYYCENKNIQINVCKIQ